MSVRARRRNSARFDLARALIGLPWLRLTDGANADEIEPMLFDPKPAQIASLPRDRLQAAFDRNVGVGYAPADAADQMVMRILGGLEVGNGRPEIEFAQAALRNQHAQIAVNGAQAQTGEAALDESVDLVRRQMAAMILNGLEDRLALFCVSDIHRYVSRPAHRNQGS
jgi:hypothetical protein